MMLKDFKYIVTICGYEGIEQMFGPFNREDALRVAVVLKKQKTKTAKKLMQHYTPDQVCIQSAPQKIFYKWNKDRTDIILTQNIYQELHCCCKDFPELPKHKNGVWLY